MKTSIKPDMYQSLRRRYGRAATIIPLVVLGVLLVGLLLYMNYYLAGVHGRWDFSDFMLIYLGGRGVVEGVDLYDPQAWEALHVHFAGVYRDNAVFLYPLPAAYLFIPFALFSIKVGAALWLLVNELLLIAGAAWVIRQRKTAPSRAEFILFVVVMALFEPTLIVIESGQYSMLMLILLILVYACLYKHKDLPGGAAASLLLLRPNPFVFFFPGLALWALVNKRWKFLAGLAGAVGLLGVLSEIVRPGWLAVWLSYTVGGSGKLYTYGAISPTLNGLFHHVIASPPGWFIWLQWLIILPLLVWGVMESLNQRRSLGYAFSFILVISLCVTPYSWNYDQVVLLFPLLFTFQYLENAGPQRKRLIWWMATAFYLALPYVLRYIAMQIGNDMWSALVPFGALLFLATAGDLAGAPFAQTKEDGAGLPLPSARPHV